MKEPEEYVHEGKAQARTMPILQQCGARLEGSSRILRHVRGPLHRELRRPCVGVPVPDVDQTVIVFVPDVSIVGVLVPDVCWYVMRTL